MIILGSVNILKNSIAPHLDLLDPGRVPPQNGSPALVVVDLHQVGECLAGEQRGIAAPTLVHGHDDRRARLAITLHDGGDNFRRDGRLIGQDEDRGIHIVCQRR